jgi:uridylate kinase
MQTICISLGGSIVATEEGFNADYIIELSKVLERYKGIKFVITVGGGYISRQYINALRARGVREYSLDELGIAFTHANAIAIKSLFKGEDIYQNIVSNIDELKDANLHNRIVFTCGYMPGITTDAVSAISCEAIGGKMLINISKEPYIYDRNPSEHGAKKLARISHSRLVELAEKYDTREAKANFIFDIVASKIAKRSNIRLEFVGEDIHELEKAIAMKPHKGSTVAD